jgi:hypothetical protein
MTFATEPNTIICPTYGHPMIRNHMQAIYIVKIVETLAVKGVRQKHGFFYPVNDFPVTTASV